jgi:hypothetical protein
MCYRTKSVQVLPAPARRRVTRREARARELKVRMVLKTTEVNKLEEAEEDFTLPPG